MGQCFARHRHQEFLKFLEHLDQEFPGEIPLHLVMELWEAQAAQGSGLAEAPPAVCDAPCAYQLQLAESDRALVFRVKQPIRRGSFQSVEDLKKAIAEFLAASNEKPKPFV